MRLNSDNTGENVKFKINQTKKMYLPDSNTLSNCQRENICMYYHGFDIIIYILLYSLIKIVVGKMDFS